MIKWWCYGHEHPHQFACICQCILASTWLFSMTECYTATNWSPFQLFYTNHLTWTGNTLVSYTDCTWKLVKLHGHGLLNLTWIIIVIWRIIFFGNCQVVLGMIINNDKCWWMFSGWFAHLLYYYDTEPDKEQTQNFFNYVKFAMPFSLRLTSQHWWICSTQPGTIVCTMTKHVLKPFSIPHQDQSRGKCYPASIPAIWSFDALILLIYPHWESSPEPPTTYCLMLPNCYGKYSTHRKYRFQDTNTYLATYSLYPARCVELWRICLSLFVHIR